MLIDMWSAMARRTGVRGRISPAAAGVGVTSRGGKAPGVGTCLAAVEGARESTYDRISCLVILPPNPVPVTWWRSI